MVAWDPLQYEKFKTYREQPGLSLIQQIHLTNPKYIFDLGCGTGKLTNMLKQRWPDAHVVGIDTSQTMLEKAYSVSTDIEWRLNDISQWQPDIQVDLIFANAALQWLDDHETLLPKLMRYLAPNGVLAVQMPNNFDQPSHTELKETIQKRPWRQRLEPLLRSNPVKSLRDYYDLLSPLSDTIALWETHYSYRLLGENPVLEWTKGTALRPFLNALSEPDSTHFIEAYKQRLQIAYPKQEDKTTFFLFKRLFFIVTPKVQT